jgi:3-deoxy-D-manno-octulosonic-acid transferase
MFLIMLIYNFILSLIYLISFPFLYLRFKGIERKQRFGKIKLDYNGVIWIHAASLGEVNAAKPLLKELLTRYPSKHFVLSTMTSTGFKAAQGISPKLENFYCPMDFPLPMHRAFKRLAPEMLILVETELWPNMLYLAKKKDIPVIMVNGRISDRSLPSYRRLLFFWKPLWKNVLAVNAQSAVDAERFKILKFKQVENTQNLKFCLKLPQYDSSKLRTEMGYSQNDFILVWGSSRPGEEKLFKQVFLELKDSIPDLKAVLVPRHLSRLSEIKQIFNDIEFSIFSDINGSNRLLIVDEMNILTMFYAISDISVVGGSFFNFGGHNPLEPAFYGVPIIMGKYHQSCRDSVEKLLEENAIIISDKKKLLEDLRQLSNDIDKARKLGENAKLTLTKNSESLKRNLDIIERIMSDVQS